MKSLINKLSAVFTLFLFLSFIPAYSQEKGITIEGENMPLEQVFERIEAQSSYTIAYNRTQLDTNREISLYIRDADIREVFQKVLEGSGWEYKIVDKHVILIKNNDPTIDKITRNMKGRVYDKITGTPLPSASVILLTDTEKSIFTDEDGYFEFVDLPIGRYDIKASHIGYESFIYNEIILTSAKTTFIEIPLTEDPFRLQEILIKAQNRKEQFTNPMILAGGRMLSVEESSRFAGGFDDPARLVTSFAGVAGGIGDNSVIIHGYAPHLLQWRLEGMEIGNPNHFADLTTMGGGIFSSLSSNVLDNSDFLTGAYPAEYNNALSGIFDMKLRTGNNELYQSNVEGSLTGLAIASEGPLKKGSKSSYLFNYRNATFSFIKRFIPDMEINNFGYQDLSFKLHLPYKPQRSISIWGLALGDKNYEKFEKYPNEWNPEIHKMGISGNQYMASGGIIHKQTFDRVSLHNSLGIVYTNNDLAADSLDNFTIPNLNLHNRSYHINASTQVNYKISPRHTNKSGITWTSMFYNFFYNELETESYNVAQSKMSGHTATLAMFSNSLFRINDQLKLNVGINGQLFLLNNNRTIEPRLGLEYSLKENHTLAFAYGLHSRLERLSTYFIKSENGYVNKNLDFIKSHQLVMNYRWNISETKSLKIESYYHSLFNIPMVSGTSYSTLNGLSFLINVPLSNEGKGVNKGIDLSFERYLSGGYYYLLTTSLYDSKYCGIDGQWFNTRYNYRFISNALGGKEWIFGRQNQHIFNSNIKFIFKGGERYTPVNEELSLQNGRLITYEDQLYKKQFSPKLRIDVTLNYKLNRKSITHEFSFKVLNITGVTEYYRHRFDNETQSIVKDNVKIILPNLSYKINF